MTNKEYIEKEKHIWRTFVPPQGQAEYVQGELLRSIAKLQDEAQRNGNINWDNGHEILASFILATIQNANILDTVRLNRLKEDISIILNYESPYIENDLYTRIAHIIVDFYISYPEPIKHKINADLHR